MDPQAYIHALNIQLTYLFSYTCKINEIDTVAALFPEYRGMQDAGWNTVATANEVFDELKALGAKQTPLTRAEVRQLLCLYTQLAEAGGFYEGLLNIMQVAKLKAYNLWPFQDLVRVRQRPQAIIGPNANAMFRRLAEVATDIGMTSLAGLLEITFRDDIRNAMAHADYILVPGGLRLRRRNGGQPIFVSNAELLAAIQIAMYFFELLRQFQQKTAELFRPARSVVGRFSANPVMLWRIELTEEGRLFISTDAPGSPVDSVYERQKRINEHLGGKMVATYISPGMNVPEALIAEISATGFEILIVEITSAEQFAVLIAEINEHILWDQDHPAADVRNKLLMATPAGFRYISTGAEFQAWLPMVDDIVVT